MTHTNKKTEFWVQVKQWIVLLTVVFLIRTFGFGFYQVPSGSMEVTMLSGDRFFADKFSYLFISPKQGDIISFNDPTFEYSQNPIMRTMQDYISIPFFGNWPINVTKRIIGVPGDEIRGAVEDGKPVIYRNGTKLDQPYVNKYSLIGVLRINQYQLSQCIEQEMRELRSQHRFDQNMVADYVTRTVLRYVDWRSYDPSLPYEKQTYYKMSEDRILKDHENKPILKLPNSSAEGVSTPAEIENKNNWNGTDTFFVKLKDNEYWLMGDNRENSKDSRWFGPITRSFIHGRIVFRVFSVDGDDWLILDLLKHPFEFWTRVRWNRFLQFIS